MPRIRSLPTLERDVLETDFLLIDAVSDYFRLPASAFRGPPGNDAPGPTVRTTATHTTDELAPGQTETASLALAPTFEALAVQSSGPCRVRLYSSASARTTDAARAIGTEPTPGYGVILEVVNPSARTQHLDPHAHGSNMDDAESGQIAAAITNTGTEPASLTITITYLPREG